MLGFLRLFSFSILVTTNLAAMAYEVCTPQNDYLEAALPAPQTYPRTAVLPITCIETAQATLALTGYYGFCADDNGQPGRTHPRPCLSDKYVSSVYNSILDVSECFSFDPRWAFAVFNLESALHLNAVGAATDIGIGQLTSTAILEVNLNALPKAKRIAAASTLDSCKRILSLLYEGDTALDRRCSFISVPNNPTHDLSFGVLLLKRNRELLEGYFKRWGLVLPAGVGEGRVKTLLSMLGYNAGIAGVASTLRAYLDLMLAEKLTDAHFNFENRSPGSFVTFVQKNFPSKDELTRNRVSKYIGYTLKSMRHVEAGLTEGLCSDPALQQTPIHAGLVLERVANPATAERVANQIKASLLDIAGSFTQVRVTSVDECKKLRAEFMYAFAPGDQGLAFLPTEIADAYAQLCAK